MPSPIPPGRSRFATAMAPRPDDIDMNGHVHASKYLDYVLAARYDQMARCYKMPMDDFIQAGLGWYVQTSHMEFKRALMLNDAFVVTTWIQDFFRRSVRVHFEITKRETDKLSAEGYFEYALINLKTGRAETIPEWIVEKYAI